MNRGVSNERRNAALTVRGGVQVLLQSLRSTANDEHGRSDERVHLLLADFDCALELTAHDGAGGEPVVLAERRGSRFHMAPELLPEGSGTVVLHGLPSDVFSFGIFAFEVLELGGAYAGQVSRRHSASPRCPRTC